MAKGAFRHTVSNRQFEIEQGDIFVIPPFTLHSIDIPPNRTSRSTAVSLCLLLLTSASRRNRWNPSFSMLPIWNTSSAAMIAHNQKLHSNTLRKCASVMCLKKCLPNMSGDPLSSKSY
ncbi:AraC family ligand binding domain-containing protein [Paenibacillus alvei]|uniref:AraC family ligand binding domain-containing protein n=1 Tax=Paenibacillus alvei TaxID=44250 RepID=UPI001E60EAD5|nr:AraC family ligand binding domain-containing protein [Paenibacillus alvei]